MRTLRELGELGVIRILERTLGRTPSEVVGFGDDVSAVRLSAGKVVVLKTDMLVASTDVPPGMSMEQIARKAVVANVSDLAAKGARPYAGLVALGLPARLTERQVLDLARGLRKACRKYGFHLVGGDTNESKDLTISIALIAIAEQKRLVLRSGAKPGDILAVTGDFGATSVGLLALLKMKKRPGQLPRPMYQAVYHPRAELELGLRLAASGALTASIDSSDGLAWSLHELAAASHVGFQVDKIPTSQAALEFAQRHRVNVERLALFGGEEYRLVVTLKRGRLKAATRAARGKLKAIGVVTSRRAGIFLKKNGRKIPIPRKGWEHFRH